MKKERMKRKSDDASDVVLWVSKSQKLEDKRNAEKEKALHFSKMFEEQDNVTQEEDEDEPPANQNTSRDLAGFKVLDGLDKVVEGGAVVLTLKDQNILAVVILIKRLVCLKIWRSEEDFVFGADDDDLDKSLQRARELALKMKDGTPSGPHAIALLATSTSKNTDAENGDSQENKLFLL
nr:SART-1 family protein DOT2 [Tanacetum cinerariifolium]